jgi:hypothetical protein
MKTIVSFFRRTTSKKIRTAAAVIFSSSGKSLFELDYPSTQQLILFAKIDR